MKLAGRLLCLILTICMIFGSLALQASADVTEGIDYSTPAELMFHRNELSKLPKGAKYTYVYDTLRKGIQNRVQYVILDETKSLKLYEFMQVLDAVRLDNPEFMSLKTTFGYYYEESEIVTYFYPLFADNITVKDEQKAINAARQFIKDVGATADMSDYEISKRFHDELSRRLTYTLDDDDGEVDFRLHSVYGALVDGKCVCEGYAESYQILMNMMGREATCVEGYTLDSLDTHGQPYAHEWNLAKINGKYYHVDTTWDDILVDGKSTILYSYCHVNDEMGLKNRVYYEYLYPLPKCTSLDMCYFTVEGGFMKSSGDIVFLANKFNDNECVHVYATDGSGQQLLSWYMNNAEDIRKLTTVKGESYGGVNVKNEALLYLRGSRLHKITVSGGGSSKYAAYVNDKITVSAVPPKGNYRFVGWKADNPNVVFANAQAISTTFSMIDSDVSIIAEWEAVTTTTTTTTAPEYKVGDINNDGETDEIDASLALRYAAGFTDLTAAQIKAGDINKDGDVDEIDASMILRIAAGLISG